MRNEELMRLKALAESASTGPWVDGGHTVWQADSIVDCDIICKMMSAEDSAFIAAANPAAILALIAKVESLAADAERYQWLLQNYAFGDGYKDIDSALNDGESDKYLNPAIDAAMAKEKA